jgi:hypothetical protein
MHTKAELTPRAPGGNSRFLTLVNARLKRLRRERRLVEKAILALTEVSRSRQSRERAATVRKPVTRGRNLGGIENVSLDDADPRRNSIDLPGEL